MDRLRQFVLSLREGKMSCGPVVPVVGQWMIMWERGEAMRQMPGRSLIGGNVNGWSETGRKETGRMETGEKET